MSNIVLHKAETRGYAHHGWLKTYHTFSFANYYRPDRMHFGLLRVLNDDTIEGGMGFDMHPHDNMEIITIPLNGEVLHRDSMGNSGVITAGEIQVMSAGSGIVHSEFNNLPDRNLELLQIWVFPEKKDVTPRYMQKRLSLSRQINHLQTIVTPYSEWEKDSNSVWIHQQAWFNLGLFESDHAFIYQRKRIENGMYCFVIEGSFEINGILFNKRDGAGITDVDQLEIRSLSQDAQILIMDIPVKY